MRLISKVEFELAPPPDAQDVRAWRDHPVTERVLNIIYRLSSADPSYEARLGFTVCRDQVLDLLNDVSLALQPPPKPVTPEEPDYGGADILKKRNDQLSANP